MRIIFFLDDAGIRTHQKTLTLIVHTHQVCTYHQVLRCWITIHAQLRSVRLYTAQQRSVAPCGAVCPSLRCCVVLRCVRYFEHGLEQYRVQYVLLCTIVYTFHFFFFSTCIRSCTAPCFFPHAKYPRTADQNVTPVQKKSTQHS